METIITEQTPVTESNFASPILNLVQSTFRKMSGTFIVAPSDLKL